MKNRNRNRKERRRERRAKQSRKGGARMVVRCPDEDRRKAPTPRADGEQGEVPDWVLGGYPRGWTWFHTLVCGTMLLLAVAALIFAVVHRITEV